MSKQDRILLLLEQLEQRSAAKDNAACIKVCEELLDLLDRDKIRELWAAIHGTLADCLRDDTIDPVKSQERAIRHYQQALSVRTEVADGRLWAGNHGSLANLYMNRRQGNRTDNLRHAIDHYRAALRVFDQQPNTLDRAVTHASLAEAFAELRGSPADVIRHGEAALTVLTRAQYPVRWLKARIALGEAYATQGQMAQAAACLQDAVSAFPKHEHAQYGYLNEKLGHCCRDAPTGKTEPGMEQTIRAFKDALSAYEAGGLQDSILRVHAQLGHCYAHRLRGDRAANVQQAIEHLEIVVERSKKDDPSLGYVNAALARLYEDPSLH